MKQSKGKSLKEVQAVLEPEIGMYITTDEDVEAVVNLIKDKRKKEAV